MTQADSGRVEDDGVEACMARERELLTPRCRADPARLQELLADDFVEIGASGKMWARATMLAALSAGAEPDRGATTEVLHLSGRPIAADVVLLTYGSETAGRSAIRSSLWRREDAGWRLFCHQGTLIPPRR